MWGTVLLMGAVAGLDPKRIGAAAYIVSRARPTRLLVAYFVGGFGVSLIAGGVVLFVLDGADIGKSSSVPPVIEIAVGVLVLLIAVLVATGIAARLRDSAQSRRPSGHDGDVPQPAQRDRGGVDTPPGFERLPQHVQKVLRSESPWVAWVAGVAIGMPSAYYLAAIAAILKSEGGTGSQIAGLLVFNVVAFAIAEIALVSVLLAPEATRARLDPLYQWVSTHQRAVIATVAGIVGVYLLIVGISKL